MLGLKRPQITCHLKCSICFVPHYIARLVPQSKPLHAGWDVGKGSLMIVAKFLDVMMSRICNGFVQKEVTPKSLLFAFAYS